MHTPLGRRISPSGLSRPTRIASLTFVEMQKTVRAYILFGELNYLRHINVSLCDSNGGTDIKSFLELIFENTVHQVACIKFCNYRL
jgi:hypothetical protein